MKNDGLTRAFGIAGALGVLTFWTALATPPPLRSDLSVLATYVSDYANGSWGTLFTLAVFAHGAGNMAIAAALYRNLGRRGLAGLGVLAFGVAAAGFFLAGIFPTDPEGVPRSVTGLVHRGAAGSFAFELTALLVLAVAFRGRSAPTTPSRVRAFRRDPSPSSGLRPQPGRSAPTTPSRPAAAPSHR